MAFGLKRKNTFADVIYMNGHIYTQDENYPKATAVACANGLVLAVGDYDGMNEIIDDDTEVIDLDGKVMFPGFIEVHETPVLDAFQDKYLRIETEWDYETVMDMLRDYAEENSDSDVIFAYGYNEHILADREDEDIMGDLDEIDDSKAIILLGESDVHVWYNHYADRIVKAAAEEDCIPYTTVSYILNLFIPFDFDEVEYALKEMSEQLCDRGITSVFNMHTPEYFEDLFRDFLMESINEDECKQRYFESLFVTRPVNEKTLVSKLVNGKNSCIEIDEYVNYDFIKLIVSSDEESNYFSQNALNTICLAVADKGLNIHIDASDEEALVKVYTAFEEVRNKGYSKNTLVIASDLDISDTNACEEDFQYSDTFIYTWSSLDASETIFEVFDNPRDIINNYTIHAADIIGKSDILGSIEKGKIADFTVFNDNPISLGMNQFPYMHAELVILNGDIVYDAEEAANDEMYNLLLSQQL